MSLDPQHKMSERPSTYRPENSDVHRDNGGFLSEESRDGFMEIHAKNEVNANDEATPTITDEEVRVQLRGELLGTNPKDRNTSEPNKDNPRRSSLLD